MYQKPPNYLKPILTVLGIIILLFVVVSFVTPQPKYSQIPDQQTIKSQKKIISRNMISIVDNLDCQIK